MPLHEVASPALVGLDHGRRCVGTDDEVSLRAFPPSRHGLDFLVGRELDRRLRPAHLHARVARRDHEHHVVDVLRQQAVDDGCG
eukprot:scaffold495_cov243-Pinguiococcus_pyrenoidosus.AAC.22